MSKSLEPQFAIEAIKIPNVGIMLSIQQAAPTNSQAGWGSGALWINTTTGQWYQNTGTSASSTWSTSGGMAVDGVAAGYRLARGVHTQAAAADTVVTGLTTVVAAVANFDSAPTVKQMFLRCTIGDQAGTPAAGSIIISTFKPTSNVNDSTPTAATDFTDNIGIAWIAVGT